MTLCTGVPRIVKRGRMARQPEKRPSSIMPVMIIGALVVVALLAFSLRRIATSRNAASQPAAPATASAAPAAEPHSAELDRVARIKPQELRDLIARNSVTVIDVRDADSYLAAHIPGSLHIPMARIDGEIPYLPKDKPIVTYCT